jgi:predicted transcriptional regulator
MRFYCEVVVGEVLPALRALITNELMKNYDLTQQQVADKLGLTQPAISQYRKYLRGENGKELQKNKKLMIIVKKFSKDIAGGKISSEDTMRKILEISHLIVHKKIVNYDKALQENVPCEICFK